MTLDYHEDITTYLLLKMDNYLDDLKKIKVMFNKEDYEQILLKIKNHVDNEIEKLNS
jgi:hypothetical protein